MLALAAIRSANFHRSGLSGMTNTATAYATGGAELLASAKLAGVSQAPQTYTAGMDVARLRQSTSSLPTMDSP